MSMTAIGILRLGLGRLACILKQEIAISLLV
jgi:hypothetical protein